MQLVRNNLKPLIQLSKLESAHAGLLMQRGLTIWEEGEKPEKARLIERISEIKAPDFYELAFDRWFALTQSESFAHVAAKVDGRLFTGLALGGTLETGMMTHHTYGTPLLAGSSIKGATHAYAESIGLPPELIQTLFGSGDEQDDECDKTVGSFVWHDAWWIPRDTNVNPFVKEVITVHEQDYYSETSITTDGTQSPTPNLQIGIQGEFYFVFEGDSNWSRYVADLVAAMLEEQGVGAKTSSGYGYFVRDDKRLKSLQKEYQKKEEDRIEQQRVKNMSDAERLVYDIQERFNAPDLAPNNEQGQEALTFLKDKLIHAQTFTIEDQQLVAERLPFSTFNGVISKKREKEFKALLNQLRGKG